MPKVEASELVEFSSKFHTSSVTGTLWVPRPDPVTLKVPVYVPAVCPLGT